MRPNSLAMERLDDAPVFIVGCLGSGATRLAETLGRFPGLLASPADLESAWADVGGVPIASPRTRATDCAQLEADDVEPGQAERLARALQPELAHRAADKPADAVLLIENPHLCNKLPFVAALFPEARFIWVHRPLPQVVAALERQFAAWQRDEHCWHYWPESTPMQTARCWQVVHGAEFPNELEPRRLFPGGDIQFLAEYWLESNHAIAAFLKTLSAYRWLSLTQESLKEGPESQIARCLAFLEQPLAILPDGNPGVAQAEEPQSALSAEQQANLAQFAETHRAQIAATFPNESDTPPAEVRENGLPFMEHMHSPVPELSAMPSPERAVTLPPVPPICIAGMHRSGTSLIARLLSLCGLYMGPERELANPAPDNEEGFWENVQFIQLNDAILAQLGGGWDLPPAMPEGWELRPDMIPLRGRAARLIQQCSAHAAWGWKDPRNSLTLPFWKRLLPNLKTVICVRSPLEVVQSLHKRSYASPTFGLNLWRTYNEKVLAETQPHERVITHYDAYLDNPGEELRRVLSLLGLPVSEGVLSRACAAISQSLRHNRTTIQDLLDAGAPPQVVKLYMDLCAEAGPVYQLALQRETAIAPEPLPVAPDAPADYREALSRLRLEALVAEREQAAQDLRDQLAAHEQAAWDLRTQLAEREQAAQALAAQVAQRDRQLEVARREAIVREQHLEQRAQADLTQSAQALEAAQAEVAQRDREVERLKALAQQGERWRQELELIRSTLAFQILARVVWPLSRRFLPAFLRGPLKSALRRLQNRLRKKNQPASASSVTEGLARWAETDLSQPFVVGKGNVLYLAGWCYHPRRKIRELHVLVDGQPHRIVNHSLGRPDVLHEQALRADLTGNSLTSGFWVGLPFEEIRAPREVNLTLQARLDNGQRCEAWLGNLTLTPLQTGVEAAPITTARPASEPVVAICMTTYNPALDLFAAQIESILQQTHQNWICIINDDCSTPSVYAEIQKIAAQDPRFQVHQNPTRLGYYYNFERCLQLVPAGVDFVALSDQDDSWYPDKLAACLSAFEADTTLVYSDMDIVTREGAKISSTYWTTRRNNYTDLAALLFANTITGAASLFRASLLEEILPFPQRIGDAYHDHWIACVALAKGTIQYVDRTLYAYRQHAGNVVGHYTSESYRLLPKPAKLFTWLRSPGTFKADLHSSLWFYRGIYFNYVIRLILFAQILKLRIRKPSAKKRALLRQFANLERSWLGLVTQGVQYEFFRRPTLGLEWHYLHGAIGQALFNFYHQWRKPQIFQHHRAMSAVSPAAFPVEAQPGVKVDVSGLVDFIPQKIAPLKLAISPQSPRRVNMLVSTVDFRYLFGGYMATFNLALQLKRNGYRVRLVIIDYCDFNPPAWRRQIAAYQGLQNLFDEVELTYVFDRNVALDVNPNDAFIGNAWWAAHVAYRAVRDLGQEKFVFLAQEYEPVFYPTGSLYALAEESYTLPHRALFSTEFLREYFRQHHLGVFSHGETQGEAHSVSFQNAINTFQLTPQGLNHRQRKRLLFYARPEQHAARNVFELGVLGLRAVIQEGRFDLNHWEFHGIGAVSSLKNLKLGHGVEMELLPRVSLQEYVEMLPSYDLGLSLMLSPHPSLVPLDMAAAGLVTVTNTYANKTCEKLQEISSNIIAVPATIGGIKFGLLAALSQVGDIPKRIAGSRVKWATTWEEAFGGEVMVKLKGFLDE